ncbi:MAG: GNAT family N-acetyltransferase [Clostridia bacterium]|nr:GNAT family N-acetyltransferase [Clostridia bacterium]
MLEFTFIYGENGYAVSKDLRDKIFGGVSPDSFTDGAYYIVGYDKTEQIAAGRFFGIADGVCKIDFVGVREDYRRQFVGDLVIKAIEDKAKSLGIKTAVLETPQSALPFFEFEGYAKVETVDGETKMRKDLTVAHKCRGCV